MTKTFKGQHMKLKDATIKALEPSNKVVKLSDGASLFLLVHPSGTKTWVYAYRFDGKQKKLTLGQYPLLSLKDARKARDYLSCAENYQPSPDTKPYHSDIFCTIL